MLKEEDYYLYDQGWEVYGIPLKNCWLWICKLKVGYWNTEPRLGYAAPGCPSLYHTNIKNLIRNRTVTKGFLFSKKHIFDSTAMVCNIFPFIFQYLILPV